MFSNLGHDVIAQAQSGTGKTATFAVTILQQLDVGLKECQALVLAPTRELAQQVCVSGGEDSYIIVMVEKYCIWQPRNIRNQQMWLWGMYFGCLYARMFTHTIKFLKLS